MSESTREVPLSSIRRYPHLRPRETDQETVERYAAAVDDVPPVRVAVAGDHFVLLDGEHRFQAHRLAGRSHIAVHVTDVPEREWAWFAFEANRRHGRPYTKEELEAAIPLLLERDPAISSRAGAKLLGLSPNTFEKYRRIHQPSGAQNEHLAGRRGADGKLYPAVRPFETEGETPVAATTGDDGSIEDRFVFVRDGVRIVAQVVVMKETPGAPAVAADGRASAAAWLTDLPGRLAPGLQEAAR